VCSEKKTEIGEADFEYIIFKEGYHTVYMFNGARILNLGRYQSKETSEYVYACIKSFVKKNPNCCDSKTICNEVDMCLMAI